MTGDGARRLGLLDAARAEFAALVYKPPGGPCIVEEGSKRPRYEATTPTILDDIFDNVENEE